MARFWLSDPWFSDPWYGGEGDFGELRRRMDELFDRFPGGRTPAQRGPVSGVFPPVNLYEAGDGFVLTAEVPGLRAEDIDVSVEANRVTLRGERKVEYPQDASPHRVERRAGAFRRTVQLPVELDGDKVEAIYRNGVLTLRIPKAPEHQPRRISVKAS
jgi:HSP20 family protein